MLGFGSSSDERSPEVSSAEAWEDDGPGLAFLSSLETRDTGDSFSTPMAN